jgi:hypothetical protein
MAEKICPICGKANPDGLENCLFCQAPLLPLGEKPLGILPQLPKNAEEDSLEWLRSSRSDTGLGQEIVDNPSESQEPTDIPENEDEPPDWINRLRDVSGLEKLPEEPHGDLQKIASSKQENVGEAEPDQPELEDLSEQLPSQVLSVASEKSGEDNRDGEKRKIDPVLTKQNGATLSDEDQLTRLASGQAIDKEETHGDQDQMVISEASPTSKETPDRFWETPQDNENLLTPLLQDSTANQQSERDIQESKPQGVSENGDFTDQPSDFAARSISPSIEANEQVANWLSGAPVVHPVESEPELEGLQRIGLISSPKTDGVFNENEKKKQPVINTDDETDELAQSHLPEWLPTMRPVDAVFTSGEFPDNPLVENSGPLAGLSAILPASDLPAYYSKPPVYSIKLNITERQRLHTGILENMLQEGEKVPVTELKKRGLSNRLARIGVGLLILLVMVPAVFWGGQTGITPLPRADNRIMTFYDLIEKLPDGVPVLVAMDYQTGYSGEMHLTATNVLARLIEKNIGLALISTVPAGPAMGIDMIERARAVVGSVDDNLSEAYRLSQRTVNLGYLTGGTAALQEFVYQPKKATFYGQDVIRDRKPVWEHAVLENVSGLKDFGMVILLCDNFNSGRAWIEQVQPNLGKVPMVVVTSAQTGPLLAPFLASGQVGAMLSGFAEGAAYSQLVQLPATPDGGWIGYQAGTIIVLILIVIGQLVQGVLSMFKNRKEQERISMNGS